MCDCRIDGEKAINQREEGAWTMGAWLLGCFSSHSGDEVSGRKWGALIE